MTSDQVLHYRQQAEKVLAQAAEASDPHVRDAFLNIAKQYDLLAQLAEEGRS